MPTPEELELLEDRARFNYDRMLEGGMDVDEAYKAVFDDQTSVQQAK